MSELDIDYIANKINIILDKEFTDPKRKNIKFYPTKSHVERLAFCCPCCGDSATSQVTSVVIFL